MLTTGYPNYGGAKNQPQPEPEPEPTPQPAPIVIQQPVYYQQAAKQQQPIYQQPQMVYQQQPQQIYDVEVPNGPLPQIPITLPAQPVSEPIPQAIYSMNTQIAQPILGQTTVNPTQYQQMQYTQHVQQGKSSGQPILQY
jgi:hypothetical protein